MSGEAENRLITTIILLPKKSLFLKCWQCEHENLSKVSPFFGNPFDLLYLPKSKDYLMTQSFRLTLYASPTIPDNWH